MNVLQMLVKTGLRVLIIWPTLPVDALTNTGGIIVNTVRIPYKYVL